MNGEIPPIRRMLSSRHAMVNDAEQATRDRRRPIIVFAGVSTLMLAASVIVRATTPSPLAPRVHVRWIESISDARRAVLERDFTLVAGQRREGTTWEYDLADPSHSTIQILINHPAVVDTHYIDRGVGAIAADAPRGTTRLDRPGAASWIHSSLFDWFVAFWISSFVVSSVRLASAAKPPRW
jgi:hypothetical protein